MRIVVSYSGFCTLASLELLVILRYRSARLAFWRAVFSASVSSLKISNEGFGEIGQLAYYEESVSGFESSE